MAKIKRHRTAIVRTGFSAGFNCLLRDDFLSPNNTVFDYGCGKGKDLELLEDFDIECSGWDPAFRPKADKLTADIVNLGFVINVIESPDERTSTLKEAWGYANRLLVVAAQIKMPGRGAQLVDFSDGVITSRNTFQKYYTQAELREYIEESLQTRAFPAAPGVFYVFQCDELREQYLSSRYRRRLAAPRQRVSEKRYEEHKTLLEPLIARITELGRLPAIDELPSSEPIISVFGTLKRAFALIRRVTGADEWEAIRTGRSEDVLVYLALAKFGKREQLSKLPLTQQRDIREFFGSYKQACALADELLFSTGDAEAVNAACKESSIGKLLPKALYVHRTAVDRLAPILRVYEGCARAWIGEIEGANIIKIHRHSGKVSYHAYPEFDSDPHPALLRTVKVQLRDLWLNCYDYSQSPNPPILHRKETFVSEDYDGYEKFARLTLQEEKQLLLTDTSKIGTRNGWNKRLEESGFELRGHRLVRTRN